MDPQAVLNCLVDALHDGDHKQAIESACHYHRWRMLDGFPSTPSFQLTPDACDTLCQMLVDYLATGRSPHGKGQLL